jgi:type IV pilus assembly protein PilE
MRVRGFTLIELLIVVAIMSLIAAVAIPSYSNQIRKNNRAAAKARLAQAAQLLERFYSDNNTYYMDITTSPCALVSTTATPSTTQAANGLMKLMNPSWGCGAPNTVYSGSNNEATSPYTLSIGYTVGGTTSPSLFIVTATIVAGTNQAADTKCGTLTLTNAGVKGISGTGTVSECW